MLHDDYTSIPKECRYMFPPMVASNGTPLTESDEVKEIYENHGSLVYFGFECDKGWYPLIIDALKDIEKIDTSKLFRVSQIKEKFGTLRLYCYGTTDEIDAIVDSAEHKSEITCELCGKIGSMCCLGTWLKTLCDKCKDRLNYKLCKEEC